MGRDDDLPGLHPPMIGHRRHPPKLGNRALLADAQPGGDLRQEFQRVKLPLPREADRPRRGEGQRQPLRQLRPVPDPRKSLNLPLEGGPVVQGVDKGVLFLKIAGEFRTKGAVAREGLEVRL